MRSFFSPSSGPLSLAASNQGGMEGEKMSPLRNIFLTRCLFLSNYLIVVGI